MRKPRNTDVERAITLICKAVVQADISTVKKMLCLAVGHPPIIKRVGILAYCARCGEIVTVNTGTWENEGEGVWAGEKLTPTDRLLTPMPVTEPV